MDKVDQQIGNELEKACKKLLDLSMRNRLLNFLPSKSSYVKIIGELPDVTYDKLVINQTHMFFKPGFENGDNTVNEVDQEELSDEELHDKYLRTNLTKKDLDSRLLKIKQKADTFYEEQGYTILHIALGFLKWKEKEEIDNVCLSPLVLIPVLIERQSVQHPFRVRWTEDEISTNYTLQTQLEIMGIEYPEIDFSGDEKSEISEYFQKIKNVIAKFSNWEVLEDICLSFFSFSKFVMWRDLSPKDPEKKSMIIKHPLLRGVFINEVENNNTESMNPEDINVDESAVALLPVKDQFNVMDADASQIAVIDAINKGMNLVVEGPPGTGKSQTITNIIAEQLSRNKKVLFVSEKMAALEVVKNRLDRCGLGDSCLELHSRHTNKKSLLDELKRTVEAKQPLAIQDSKKFDDRDFIANKLNKYTEVLRTEIGEIKKTPYSLFGQFLSAKHIIEINGSKIHFCSVGDAYKISEKEYNIGKKTLTDFSELLPIFQPIKSNPWQYCRPTGVFLESDRVKVDNNIKTTIDCINDVLSNFESLNNFCGTNLPDSIESCLNVLNAVRFLGTSPIINQEIILDNRWDEGIFEAESIVNNLKKLQTNIADLEYKIAIPIHVKSLNDLIQEVSNEKLRIEKYIEELTNNLKELSNLTGCFIPNNLEEVSFAIDSAKTILDYQTTSNQVLINPEWNELNIEAENLLNIIENIQSEYKYLSSVFKHLECDKEIKDNYNFIKKVEHNIFRFFMPEYWKVIRTFQTKHLIKSNSHHLVRNVKRLIENFDHISYIESLSDKGKSLFGDLWVGKDSNVSLLKSFSNWIVTFRKSIVSGYLTERTISVVNKGFERSPLDSLIKKTLESFGLIKKSLMEFSQTIGIQTLVNSTLPILKTPICDISIGLFKWIERLNTLHSWMQWRNLFGTSEITNLAVQLDIRTGCWSSIYDLFNELKKCLNDFDDFNLNELKAKNYFGNQWKNLESSVENLNLLINWIKEFRCLYNKEIFSDKSASVGVTGVDKDSLSRLVISAENSIKFLQENICLVEKFLVFNIDVCFKVERDNVLFRDWIYLLESWQNNLSTLSKWVQFLGLKQDLLKTCAHFMVSPLEQEEVLYNLAIPTYDLNIAEALLRPLLEANPVLKKFIVDNHERLIKDFMKVDKELMSINQQRLARLLYLQRPSFNNIGLLNNSSVGILLNEFNKKRKHLPIRKLLNQAGKLIQSIKPCFMMSPLSIAQFIELGNLEFDVIIFDEASQVRPEDAIGSLLRGKQLVVMGDSQQLPPTSFFDKIDYEDEDIYEDDVVFTSITDVESILHQCKRFYNTKWLKWHYRSRHESLITVSNSLFYNNNLLVFPSADKRISNIGLELKMVSNSIYDRGKSSQNQEEAKAVVKAAMEHFDKFQGKSLGIGTFSMKQQDAILTEVQRVLREQPEKQDYFNFKRQDYCFIKNLETIQGDERDVIFVSMGYGKSSDGRVLNNFGPLNKDGGYRRLNVLMTRARERCVIFSNFSSEDLKTDNQTPRGVSSLKNFLDYAKNRNLNLPSEIYTDTDSPFEDSVKQYIESLGYEVHTQVGVAEFRIDLAIIDPQHQGRYILAIECDGRQYHSSLVARDRDRLRQEVLENMGWQNRIHRIWSIDWFHNFQLATSRLIAAIKLAEQLPRINDIESEKTVTSLKEPEVDVIKRVVSNEIDQEFTDNDIFQTYFICNSIPFEVTLDIYKTPINVLAVAVQQVVDIESPVHHEIIIRRIRDCRGLQKAGIRIRGAIEEAINHAINVRKIIKRNCFYWSTTNTDLRVRTRPKDILNVDWLPSEEIEEVYKYLLKKHFATLEQSLIIGAANAFGFQVVREATFDYFKNVLNTMIDKKVLIKNSQMMVDLP